MNPATTRSGGSAFFKVLGPGIMFAAAAVGVSHLVQSTRAGAVYGLALIPLILIVHALKYPALSAGPRYAAATGTSLLAAYREQGRPVLGCFLLITVGTMFTIQAAIALVTSGVLLASLPESARSFMGDHGLSTPQVAIAFIVLAGLLVGVGGFRWLDRTIKVLMLLLTLATVLATASLFGSAPWKTLLEPPPLTAATIVFVVALLGWMPAPLDIAVWNSLWSIERRRQTGHTASTRHCKLEFNLGLVLCATLACAFVLLGAFLMHARGITPETGAIAFSRQLLGLYTEALGHWARPIIATAAVAVMFSTLLTVTDAIPRSLVLTIDAWRADDDAIHMRHAPEGVDRDAARRPFFWVALVAIAAGAGVILLALPGRLALLVDVATTLSFFGTAVLAWFNHRAMRSNAIPTGDRPSTAETMLSWAGIAVFASVAIAYIPFGLLRPA